MGSEGREEIERLYSTVPRLSLRLNPRVTDEPGEEVAQKEKCEERGAAEGRSTQEGGVCSSGGTS